MRPRQNIWCRRQRVALVWLMLVSSGARADHTELYLDYKVRVGWLDAGQLSVVLRRSDDQYELFGELGTNAALRILFAWSGQIAAVGGMNGDQPSSSAYFLTKNKNGAKSYLLAAHKSTTKINKRGIKKVLPKPAGTDLMSALFVARDCFRGGTVHDGEDSYSVQLRQPVDVKLSEPSGFFSGAAKLCHYKVHTKRSYRRITLWLAPVGGQVVPVKVRYHMPFRPDGIVLLRLPDSG